MLRPRFVVVLLVLACCWGVRGAALDIGATSREGCDDKDSRVVNVSGGEDAEDRGGGVGDVDGDHRSLAEEGRGRKGGNQQQKGVMERILPMMVMPFMVSTGMIPMMLISLKMMMLKSALIGKIAVILMLINMFRSRSNRGGVFTHNIMGGGGGDRNEVIMGEHYGYRGDEEYGAYISKRKRRRK